MPQIGFTRRKAPDYEANQPQGEALKRANLVNAHLLRFSGNHVVTGGTGAGTILAEAIHRYARSIELRADGKPFFKMAPVSLAKLLRFWRPSEYPQDPPAGLAAATSDPILANWLIPHFMPWAAGGIERFALPLFATADPEIIVTWADPADIAENEDGVISVGSPKVELFELPLEGAPTDNPSERYGLVRIMQTRQPVTQSGPLSFELSDILEGWELRAVMVEALSGGSGGAHHKHNDALIDEFTFDVNDRERFKGIPFAVQQDRNVDTYQLDAAETGAILIDAAEDGSVVKGDLWTVSGKVPPNLDFEVVPQSGDEFVRVTTIAALRR